MNTISEIQKRIKRGDSSARTEGENVIRAIKNKDADIHAYLSFDEERILQDADMLDARIKAGEIFPLAGVPIAVKDNILMNGVKGAAASKMLESYRAPYDATVIRKLKAAGAIMAGRTNMDEFAMGSSTENSAFGATKNPHDTARVPGGSSGGSAAAVAAGTAVAALGSDTGGSIRQPAAFCGVVGLKPTYGRVSRHGLIAMASSLDQIGPLTQTVEDAKIIFDLIKGVDTFDSTTVELTEIEGQEVRKNEKMHIGVPREYFGDGLNAEVRESVMTALHALEAAGHTLHDISLPYTDYALACYYVIMPAEVSANLARFDGIRYGLSKDADVLIDVYKKTRGAGFGEEVRRRIMLGTYVLSAGYYDAYYTKAGKVRARIKHDFERAFGEVDVIVSPTTPTPAFNIGEKIKDPLSMYLEDAYTVPANIAGIPALSVPCGKTSTGLPIGIQFMARWFDEDALFDIGKEWEHLRT
ncbi:MAG: Asp-tRNA(Asn)/Glu-tRNA(Gln) amidotransferase GatCAB subunit A [Candidatus Ryanbacteria bacterium CG10_big_fil_rev_8_21_14_0_10_43_42]|uniref:Glutamyl-tRNA(Gln) amidotransferase subunit A n=1 Tax=Candidatus Ryanbacteria bacterium CG10_big_fil_rev_8_21_14_0_10_43_42 TaxID=1974864 RepID=A0A2M8KYD3_9BACT|nr:MAG: Asp-tRNA(Asn)/Glu-tRNA(Gln) amidotransferase GatCAB subunit A [Candidatus Ryanbacteria bacterium CG10_big_fil_rev_8_21_14_0_10_43_42]